MTPVRIGKYIVLELLGRGGMGEVYLGEDPYIGRRVAIKVIKGADPEARDRFLHEARVIGGLAHPAIVSLLDFDFSGEEPFLVMEYLKGQGLDAWIKTPHSLDEQLVVLDDLCQALSYAHENGVLHRDVKPSNVQILPNGHAKLMDFGIARAAAGRLTATGAVMGTPEYMAPEILNDAVYSPRSDLYACAVLLYEMFTGANPFAAKTVAASLTNVLTLNPPDLRVAHPEFPKPLANTIMACLHKDPALRPDGFGALLAASREASGGPPLPGVEETRAIPQTPAPFPARSMAQAAEPSGTQGPWLWARGAAFVIVVLALVWQLNRGAPPSGPVEPGAASPSPLPTMAAAVGSVAPTPDPAMSPGHGAPSMASAARSPREPFAHASVTPSGQGVVSTSPTPAPGLAETEPSSPALSLSTLAPKTPSSTPTEPVTIPTPLPLAPAQPVTTGPVVSGVSPRTVRRGSSVDLEIRGEGLRRDMTALVLQGRRPAAGIRVLRQEFVSSGLIRIRVLIEAETPLLSYSIVFQEAGGGLTQGVQVEVVL